MHKEIKEKNNAEIIVLTMGPDDFVVSLQEALSLGADRAVLLSDRAFAGADTLATGYVLGKAIEKIGQVVFERVLTNNITATRGERVDGLIAPRMAIIRAPRATCRSAPDACMNTSAGYSPASPALHHTPPYTRLPST